MDLEGFVPGFYLEDGLQFSDIGLDIFNIGVLSMVEDGMRRWVGPRHG